MITAVGVGNGIGFKGRQAKSGPPIPTCPCISFECSVPNTVYLYQYNNCSPVLDYSTDGKTWTRWDYSALPFGGRQYLFIRGKNPGGFSLSDTEYCTFKVTGTTATYNCTGDIMSLLDYETQVAALPIDFCFTRTFLNEAYLETPPEISALVMRTHGLFRMFEGCTRLTSIPDLHATTLAWGCFGKMFEGCTSLTSVTTLPSANPVGYSYHRMFCGCTGLTEIPVILPSMSMQLACYKEMFMNCTGITKSPILPATSLAQECYAGMFYGCTSLNEVTCYAVDHSATSCTSDWLYNVSSSGTFIQNASASWDTGSSAIPANWIVTTSA